MPDPDNFDVSEVVAGSQRTPTLYAYAMGKWSDAGDGVTLNSTEIHCYKSFGFCEVASAFPVFNKASVQLNSFDILRWDNSELIAVDSSPICVVNTIRFDFAAKKVSISSTSKGVKGDKFCVAVESDTAKTAFLMGFKDADDQFNKEIKKAHESKSKVP